MADLTTRAKVKDHLGYAAADADALLDRLVSAASAAIQRYTNRDIVQQAYTEVRDGLGGPRMLLRQYPAQKPTSVTVDDIAILERPSALAAGWKFDGNRVVALNGFLFTRGFSNVVITYTAGFATVPADIELAANELVALVFRQRGRIGDASKTVAAGSGHETVAYMMRAMTPTTKAILDQFREVVPV